MTVERFDYCKRWGPSEHRNVRGRADHALVFCKWKWRLHKSKKKPKKDFAILLQTDAKGLRARQEFNEKIEETVQELGPYSNVDEQYEHMCKAINKAMSTLPNRQAGGGTIRSVSDRTRSLFEK